MPGEPSVQSAAETKTAGGNTGSVIRGFPRAAVLAPPTDVNDI